jgi:hypothetical protein
MNKKDQDAIKACLEHLLYSNEPKTMPKKDVDSPTIESVIHNDFDWRVIYPGGDTPMRVKTRIFHHFPKPVNGYAVCEVQVVIDGEIWGYSEIGASVRKYKNGPRWRRV